LMNSSASPRVTTSIRLMRLLCDTPYTLAASLMICRRAGSWRGAGGQQKYRRG